MPQQPQKARITLSELIVIENRIVNMPVHPDSETAPTDNTATSPSETAQTNYLNDRLFKHNFGTPERRAIAIDFLNSVLKEDSYGTITELDYRNSELIPERDYQKLLIIDILCTTDRGEQIDIEVQVILQDDFAKRVMAYWAKLYIAEVKKAQSYEQCRRTIIVSLLADNLMPHTDYHSRIQAVDRRHDQVFTDVFDLHILEIDKFIPDKPVTEMSTVEKWLAVFSRKVNKQVKDEIAKSEGAIAMMMQESELFLQDQDNYTAYLFAEEAERVRRSHERAWEKRGIEIGEKRGIEIGEKRGIEKTKDETVLKLHRMNISKDVIAKACDYSLKKVDEIIANAQKNAGSGKQVSKNSRENAQSGENFDNEN